MNKRTVCFLFHKFLNDVKADVLKNIPKFLEDVKGFHMLFPIYEEFDQNNVKQISTMLNATTKPIVKIEAYLMNNIPTIITAKQINATHQLFIRIDVSPIAINVNI